MDKRLVKRAEYTEVEKSTKNFDRKIENVEKNVDKQTVNLRKDMGMQIIKSRIKMDKEQVKVINDVDKANVDVPKKNLKKILPKKVKNKGFENVTKQPVKDANDKLQNLAPMAKKKIKKLVSKTSKSAVKSSVTSPVPKPAPHAATVTPQLKNPLLKKPLLKKCVSKLTPLQSAEEVLKVLNKPRKELTLLWSRAHMTELSEVKKNRKINYCDTNCGFMTNLKNALLTIPTDGKPFVYRIQVSYIQLEIRYPAATVCHNSLPSVTHYTTLDPAKFANSMEIARFIDKKTKEQIMTWDYSGVYDAEHLKTIVGRSGFSFKKVFRFILRAFFVALNLSILGQSILIVVAISHLHCYNSEPVTSWVRFLYRVRDFIQICVNRLMYFIELV